MAAGLRIFNDAGIIQIDDTFKNFFLDQSGYVTTDATGFAEVWITSDTPMIVAASSPNGATITHYGKSGNSWQYNVRSVVAGDQVKWYAFSAPQQVAFADCLRVYDANGSITYDSNQKPLFVSYFLSLDAPIPPYQSSAPKDPERPQAFYVSLSQGRTYAAFSVSSDPISIFYLDDKVNLYDHYIYMPQQRSGGVNFYPHVARTDGDRLGLLMPKGYQPRALLEWRVQQYWIIDVTGY